MTKPFHVVLCYKHYQNNPCISHIGLGVTAMNIGKYLNSHGVHTIVHPAVKEADIESYLHRYHNDITHFIVSALWVKTDSFAKWTHLYPTIQFATICHSQVAFLQHEPAAITLIKEAINLEETRTNFHLCGNSERFCVYIENAFGAVATNLPNLYYLHKLHAHPHHKPFQGGTLRIGVFGATRALKNFNTAVAGAIQVSRELKVQTEIYINTGRDDGSGARPILQAMRNQAQGVPLVKIIDVPWMPWPEFRKVIASMHILLQPSYSETFNGVTADGVVEGVASVVSDAISWAPKKWKADVDDVNDVARTAIALLYDSNAVHEGIEALKKYNEHAFKRWVRFLTKPHYVDPHHKQLLIERLLVD